MEDSSAAGGDTDPTLTSPPTCEAAREDATANQEPELIESTDGRWLECSGPEEEFSQLPSVRFDLIHRRKVSKVAQPQFEELWRGVISRVANTCGCVDDGTEVLLAGDMFEGQQLASDQCVVRLRSVSNERGFKPLDRAASLDIFLKAVEAEAVLCTDDPLEASSTYFHRSGLLEYKIDATSRMLQLAEGSVANKMVRLALLQCTAAICLAPTHSLAWSRRASVHRMCCIECS